MTRTKSLTLQRALLDEARRVLLADGYTSLSMRKIAKAVGYTATSIYIYFAGKDALIHAMIDEGMDRLHERLETVHVNGAAPRERLASLCRAYVDFGLENPEYYEVMFMLHPSHMERYPAERYRRARRNLAVFVDALGAVAGRPAERDGAPRDRDLVVVANLIWTNLHGTISLLVAERIDVKIDREELIDLAVRHATLLGDDLPDAPGAA